MIRWIETRLVVEKPLTHEKFYPKILAATTQASAPFSISYAEIQVVSNAIGSTSSYISQIKFDDIVRLQVSIKMNPNERTVWQDIFQGRVMDMYGEYGTSNDVTLYCQGHEVEAETALIEETKAYTAPTDAKTVLSYFSKYLTRLTYSSSYADTGIIFPTYDSTAGQTYMSDLFSDMEKVSGEDWHITVVPTYSNKNLSTVYLQWKPFSTVPTTQYKIIEGTSRLINADFSTEGKGVRTAYRVNGDTPSGSPQYTGYAEDAALISQYGKRSAVDTQAWVKSNTLCASIASGILSEEKLLKVSGQVTIIGTPEAAVGDLVYCKIPSISLNGSSIEGNFTVYRVQHILSENEFDTSLDLGKIRKTPYDYLGQVSQTAKICKKNQVK